MTHDKPCAARLLVVRPAGNITGADVVAAGPFNPEEA